MQLGNVEVVVEMAFCLKGIPSSWQRNGMHFNALG